MSRVAPPAWRSTGRRALAAAVAAALTVVGSAGGAAAELDPGYGTLTWAPGSAITFGAVSGGTYVVNADGSGLRRLTSIGSGDAWLRWSPDGRTLLLGDRGKLYTLASGGAVRKLGLGWAPVWSPDGRRIAFAGGVGGGFYVARADGSGAVRVAQSGYIDLATEVEWSPDGRQIAYVACTAPNGSWGCEHSSSFDVYVSSASGGARQRITTKTGFPQCVRWSRRGWLAWSTGDGTIGVARPGGRVRTFGPGGGCPVWSPDGRRYVVATATGLGLLNGDGTGRRYLRLSSHASFADPVWSPDGKHIAVVVTPYRGNPQSHGELYTLNADGTGFRRIGLPRR